MISELGESHESDRAFLPIPYERQITSDACGAAALAMVYRSFGLTCSQDEIWPRSARAGHLRVPRTKTWLLCADALNLGLAAMTLKVCDPWSTLQLCAQQNIRAIVNHRLSNETPVGHYSVLVAIDDQHVLLHDPQLGPERRLSRDELLDLWGRRIGDWEITGRVLLAVARPSPAAHVCPQCGAEAARSMRCAACGEPVPLEPARLLGCLDAQCAERTWEQLFCPHCDFAVNPSMLSAQLPLT